MIKDWDIKLASTPISIGALKIDSGNMLMGNKKNISFEKSANIDRES